MYKRTRDYSKDYTRVGGKLQYTGKYYRFDLPVPEQHKRKLYCFLLLCVAAGLLIALGLVGTEAFGGVGKQAAFYVVLPYVGLMLPLGIALGRSFLLLILTRPMEFAQYDKYIVRQRGTLAAAFVLACALALGQIAFLFFGGGGAGITEIAAFCATILCAGCIFAANRQFHALFQSITIDEISSVRYDI